MALAISNIPVLKGELAEEFIRKAKEAEKEKGSIDCSKMMETMYTILERSKQLNNGSTK